MTSSLLHPSLSPAQRRPTDSPLIDQVGSALGLADLWRLRQVHALEHATIWVLTGAQPMPVGLPVGEYHPASLDDGRFSGLSTPQGFYLTGDIEVSALSQAAKAALQRLNAGEWNLAIHPRCGTNLSVSTALMVGLSLMAAAVMPRRPLEQCLGLGAAAVATAAVSPVLGALAQQYVTTAPPENLAIARVYPVYGEETSRPKRHFVQVKWHDAKPVS